LKHENYYYIIIIIITMVRAPPGGLYDANLWATEHYNCDTWT